MSKLQGAKWNFVLWGALHGVLLALERWRGKRSLYHALPRIARIALTFLFTLFAWVLFRSDDLTSAMDLYLAMFGLGSAEATAPLLAATIYTPYHLAVLALSVGLLFQPLQAHDWAQSPVTWGRAAMLTLLFVFSLAVMFAQAFNPFLYFQF